MSFASFCVRRPAFTTMLFMLFVVTGIFSFRDLSVDLLPKADPATVQVSITLPGASPEELSSAVVEPTEQSLSSIAGIDDKQIRRGIETVDGVGEVTISGGRAREIQVILDIEKLNAHGLTVDKVRDAIVSENVEIPGGRIEQGDAELTLSTLGRLESSEQFTNVVVATAGGTPIRLRDVAAVEDTTEEARTSAFFDGERTV